MMKREGFTLIELIIAVSIVGILAAVAVPQYQDYIKRGFRGDAIRIVQQIMTAQERYYTDNIKYALRLSQLGFNTDVYTTDDVRYEIRARKCTDSSGNTLSADESQCIEVLAEAIGVQKSDGNLIANTYGRQDRIVDNDYSKPLRW